MKVSIQKVSMKNFLSVGNKWLTIDFREGLYRVTGDNLDNNTKNGVGKSSVFIDSLMFGLFGKPVRKITLPDLPNTINGGKACEVKLLFSIEDKDYLIHRGIKPGFLKLYENYNEGDEDTKKNKDEIEDSAKKFTQKRIDDLIASNFNTLSHLLIMSNTYTSPFLDLDTKKKREIIEDILGVSVFGCMAEKAKEESLSLKSELKVSEKEYELGKNSCVSMEENISKLKEKAEEFEDKKKSKLNKIKTRLKEINDETKEIEDKIEDETGINKNKDLLKKHLETNKDKQDDLSNVEHENNALKNTSNNRLKQLKNKPTCPICNTETSSDHIKEHMSELESQVEVCVSQIKEANDKRNLLIEKEEQIIKKIDILDNKLEEAKNQVREIEDLKKEKSRIKEDVLSIKGEKNNFLELINEEELQEKKDEIDKLEIQLEDLGEQRKYYEYIRKLLSDDGIKNYIIKKVLKFWNTKVNFYLNELNAEFSIYFDELLNATIKSRNRDPLQYHSFSGGEKARIDVAILLSIIDISKIQNSIDLNVMVIDELLDGGLDDNGREDVLNLFKLMTQKQGKSIYVISHNSNLPLDLFDKEINLIKKNGYTSTT
jgi:DNA repair exonuclease SbcCD ATPase subunit